MTKGKFQKPDTQDPITVLPTPKQLTQEEQEKIILEKKLEQQSAILKNVKQEVLELYSPDEDGLFKEEDINAMLKDLEK